MTISTGQQTMGDWLEPKKTSDSPEASSKFPFPWDQYARAPKVLGDWCYRRRKLPLVVNDHCRHWKVRLFETRVDWFPMSQTVCIGGRPDIRTPVRTVEDFRGILLREYGRALYQRPPGAYVEQ